MPTNGAGVCNEQATFIASSLRKALKLLQTLELAQQANIADRDRLQAALANNAQASIPWSHCKARTPIFVGETVPEAVSSVPVSLRAPSAFTPAAWGFAFKEKHCLEG